MKTFLRCMVPIFLLLLLVICGLAAGTATNIAVASPAVRTVADTADRRAKRALTRPRGRRVQRCPPGR